MLDTLPSAPPPQEIPPPIIHAQECQGVSSVPDSQPNERRFLFHSSWMRDGTAGQGRECVETAAGTSRWGRAEGRDGAKQKRRCYQRRSGCTYAWNRPTSTGAGGSDPLWTGRRGE